MIQSDIEGAIRNDANCCPVARCIKRCMKAELVEVQDSESIIVNYENYCSDKELDQFIDAFDAGKPVEPISFELRLEEQDEEEYID